MGIDNINIGGVRDLALLDNAPPSGDQSIANMIGAQEFKEELTSSPNTPAFNMNLGSP